MCWGERTPPPSQSGAGTCSPGSTATGCVCASAAVTSQTVATSPANRARTRLGVGEEVDLTYSLGSASWTKTGAAGTLSPTSGAQSTFTAGDAAGTVTITATGGGCTATITFTIVEPNGWSMRRKSGTRLRHVAGRPSCGWKGIKYLHPNDVNFYNLETRELDSLAVATGCYNPSHHDKYHGNYPPPDRAGPWISIVTHTDAGGSGYGGTDTVYSGYPPVAATGSAPPFTTGNYYWPIVQQWRVVGQATVHSFPTVRQEHEIFSDGRCESRKGGNNEHTMYNDPESEY